VSRRATVTPATPKRRPPAKKAAPADGISVVVPRWRPVLGDDLADRVARIVGPDPVAARRFCLDAVEAAVVERERQAALQAAAAKAKRDCPHPEAERTGNRCRRCGTRGLPAVSKRAAVKP